MGRIARTPGKSSRHTLVALKPILDSRLMLLAEIDGELAGVCQGFPDWGTNAAIFQG